ncbi:MAG TPA: cytochrome c-type biogenesis CcmF C-terminal domain-containing protein [Ignavibacteria bacterium]|nr:cytochrome c-type biogenesis CcmF C-terminal domain-containing protein [Ignavibacteria bacterium]
MLGKFLIYIAFAVSVLSIISFLLVHFKQEKYLKFGRIFYYAGAFSVIGASAFMLYNILSHQFQYTYVWEQSNRELGLPLLISTFYAGQEGSFMLWTFMTAVIGIFLMRYLGKGDRLEPQVMSVYSLVLAFLAFILILKSPFNYVWDSFPGEVEYGFIPPDGRGLNPLLQNFWMSIHPPTLFVGFSSMAVPFCFAIGTLMKNRYKDWIGFAMPWLLFSGGILGLGIMMGGYWAYGVLGWGGYWAWDPVENSSFIPWLIIVAAIHTMVAQKRTGGYIKTNLILCIIAYLLVLYSTFLTRSGVLGDSSVHSFVDPGQEVYLSLIVFISLFILIAIFAFVFRIKTLKKYAPENKKLLTRENALFVGSLTLCAAAVIILAGTSWPIIAKGSIDAEFYNRMNLPVAILIAFINGISLLLKWKTSSDEKFIQGLFFPLILAVIVTIGLVLVGVQDFLFALFALAALFAFFVNIEIAVRLFKKQRDNIGAYIAHVGLALVFLGIIASAKYSKEENLTLELNKPVNAFGYTMTYVGASPFEDANNKTDTKYHFNILLEKDGKEMVLQPVMYYSAFSQGVMKNPDIANFATKDLYISPMGLVEPETFAQEDLHEFKKGEVKQVGDLSVEFVDFDFGNMQKGGEEIQSGNFEMGAILKVKDSKFTENILTKIKYTDGNPEYYEAKMTGNDNYSFYFTKMAIKGEEEGGPAGTFAIVDNRVKKEHDEHQVTEEALVITASIKPFINILWAGTIILVAGFFISIIRRRKEIL